MFLNVQKPLSQKLPWTTWSSQEGLASDDPPHGTTEEAKKGAASKEVTKLRPRNVIFKKNVNTLLAIIMECENHRFVEEKRSILNQGQAIHFNENSRDC